MNNFYKIFVLYFLFWSPIVLSANHKKKILATIPPIAGLVKAIVGDNADVDFIQNSNSCPDHHSIKPSEIFALNNVDYIVFIDNKFESYLKKPLQATKAEKLVLSKVRGLKILDNNYHLWLDLDAILHILEEIKDYFESKGFNKIKLEENYLLAVKNIHHLKSKKNITNTVIIGESLRYLSNDEDINVKYYNKIGSLKNFMLIEKYIKENNIKCVIYDHENKAESLGNKNIKLIQLDIEHWDLPIKNLEGYFFEYTKKLYKEISRCNSYT